MIYRYFLFSKFIEISSTERQMELLEQYTADQPMINWKSMFEGLQDYRKKAFEQSIQNKKIVFVFTTKILP